MKDIRYEICKDMPQKTDINKPYFDNIDAYNRDRVSGLHDNGLTPLQMQEGDKPVEATTPENAIDDDVIDIMAIYPPWSQMT